jgi:membrane protease YdiL (CAAX protease family)
VVVTVLTASGLAIFVLLMGSLPWAFLGAWNQRVGVAVPWAIIPMAVYLWAYFGFIGGRWGTADPDRRRSDLRANGLPGSVWRAALPAGLLGFGAILALLVTVSRLVRLPEGAPITTPPGMPAATMFALLAMQSVVAGVTEESAFRGYMQSIIGRRLGVVVAILASGVLFGLLHFPNHPGAVLVMLPYYVAVSAMYGGLTWATNSILPAVLLHSVGDIVVLTRWWLTGRPEWQFGAVTPPLVWDSGMDLSFVATALVAVMLCVLTAWSYQALHARSA